MNGRPPINPPGPNLALLDGGGEKTTGCARCRGAHARRHFSPSCRHQRQQNEIRRHARVVAGIGRKFSTMTS
jgi:hypothetical protein